MKRDMDLVRLILFAMEGDPDASQRIREEYVSTPQGGLLYDHHEKILHDAGFIDFRSQINPLPGQSMYAANASRGWRLTWNGHEFLETIREDRVWAATKEKVLKPGASWTMGLLLEVAKAEIRKHIGLI